MSLEYEPASEPVHISVQHLPLFVPANMAHVSLSGTDSSRVAQVNILEICQVVPSSLGGGVPLDDHPFASTPSTSYVPQREQLVSVGGLLPERQGQNLALTVLYVP